MTPAEGEGRPAQAGREGRWTRASKRSHLSRQRPGSGGRGGCEVQPEPEPGAGWQGRSGVCEGAQGEGVSLGRAPSGARLEQRLPELRRPAPSQRAPRPVPGSLAAQIPNGSRPNYSPAVQDSERPQILPEEKGSLIDSRQLNPCSTAAVESSWSGGCAQEQQPLQRETSALHLEEPRSPQLETACVKQQDPAPTKISTPTFVIVKELSLSLAKPAVRLPWRLRR
ncbi:uncharacterized protein LOC122679010 [Cervus elaphus]|uniref:uncharacterized protein LOC122679010 n=1 Tax=Cervus elaphus TaxID=9860 RepID=UPI001CC2BE00|nr:uncharacterized protein LOC122679010 [Cervus elaphus]